MGGVVPSGETNEELVDNLVEAEYITKPRVEEVFRKVDRGDYISPSSLEDDKREAYTDSAWRKGTLHLSAPCIYARAVEALDIRPGSSFLNVGSGTGYLSTLVGLLIGGGGGTNHGVELYPDNVAYAHRKLQQFREASAWYDPAEMCEPQFFPGNGLQLGPENRKYEKIYIGASCTDRDAQIQLAALLEVGGTIVMPTESELVAMTRGSGEEWSTQVVLGSVVFSPLVLPSGQAPADLDTFTVEPLLPTLKDLCKQAILQRVTRARYSSIDTLPLPAPVQDYLKCGRDWSKPRPQLKKMCPYTKPPSRKEEDMSEEEAMAREGDRLQSSRIGRQRELQLARNRRGEHVVVYNLGNGLSIHIPFDEDRNRSDDEGEDEVNNLFVDARGNPVDLPPHYNQLAGNEDSDGDDIDHDDDDGDSDGNPDDDDDDDGNINEDDDDNINDGGGGGPGGSDDDDVYPVKPVEREELPHHPKKKKFSSLQRFRLQGRNLRADDSASEQEVDDSLMDREDVTEARPVAGPSRELENGQGRNILQRLFKRKSSTKNQSHSQETTPPAPSNVVSPSQQDTPTINQRDSLAQRKDQAAVWNSSAKDDTPTFNDRGSPA